MNAANDLSMNAMSPEFRQKICVTVPPMKKKKKDMNWYGS